MVLRWVCAGLAAGLLLSGCGAPSAPVAAVRAADEAETLWWRDPPAYDKTFPEPYKSQPFPVKVIGHRGFDQVAPENTLSSFKAAVAAGADAVEFDIHLTADDQLVVIHDWSLERTTDGHGKVEEKTLAELKQLDAGAWFSPKFEGERLPSLDEALAVLDGRATPLIEVKTASDRVAKPLYEALARHGMTHRAIVTSFFEDPITGLHQAAPEVPLAVLVPPFFSFTNRALDRRASITQGYYKRIGPKNVKLAHSLGLRMHAWTVDEESDMRALVDMGIDGLITNDVPLARRVVQARFAPEPSPGDPTPTDPGHIPGNDPVAQGTLDRSPDRVL